MAAQPQVPPHHGVQINGQSSICILLTDDVFLYEAALKGDWESVRETFLPHKKAKFDSPVNTFCRTALHVAAGAGHSEFVIKIVEHMSKEGLERQDKKNGNTALHFASLNAGIEAVKAMVEFTENKLTQIRNKKGLTPLLLCAAYITNDRKDVLQYLCSKTIEDGDGGNLMPIFSGNHGAQLVCNITSAGLYDVAIDLVTNHPKLATARDTKKCSLLDVLARKSSDFRSGSQLGFWQRRIYSMIPSQVRVDENHQQNSNITGAVTKFLSWSFWIRAPGIKDVYLKKSANDLTLRLLECICYNIPKNEKATFFGNSSILRNGAKFGIVELVTKCIQTYPDQIWLVGTAQSIFHTAVKYRKGKIFSIMYGTSRKKRLMACWRVESGNNILHLAAKLPPPDVLNVVAGAALQMQRELQWFR
ncbi:hypothetical protein MKW94_010953, partial [Papaver nudicaule]|nr:hypothetical protein [Papaver nudicaule]